ncbi:hypothetical protein D3C80_960790 [compost metagenome]
MIMAGMIVVMIMIVIVVMAAAGSMVVRLVIRLFACGLFLRQQGGFEAELAQRVLDLVDCGFPLREREVQPLARDRDLDVGNTGQTRECRLDLRRAAAAIHAADRKGQGIALLTA